MCWAAFHSSWAARCWCLTPNYLVPLVTTSAGKKLLFIGIALLGMGFWSMKFIIKKSVS